MDKIEEISLGDILRIIVSKRKAVTLIVILSLLVGTIYTFLFNSPSYSVIYKIRVKEHNTQSIGSMVSVEHPVSTNNIDEEKQDSTLTAFKSLNTDQLVTVFNNDPYYFNQLSKEITKGMPMATYNVNRLKNMISISSVSGVQVINVKVTSSLNSEAMEVGKISTDFFKKFIEDKNQEFLSTNINAVKENLNFDISLLNNRINRLEREFGDIEKTVSSRVDLNPAYTVYIENITMDKIKLSNAKAQYEEIEKMEAELYKKIKEDGFITSIETPDSQSVISSEKNHLLNIIMSGLVGLIVGAIYAFLSTKLKKNYSSK